MIINKTEKFKLRKSKKYKNLVSVGLGVVTAAALGVATDTQAHASNTETSTNSATSNNTVQVRPTQEQAIALQNENNSQGAVKVTVDSSQRDKKVEEAKKQGVEVIKNETKDLGVAKTKEEAESYKDYLITRQILLDDSEGGKYSYSKENWCASYDADEWILCWTYRYSPSRIYFQNEKALKNSLEVHKEQWETVRKYEMGEM